MSLVRVMQRLRRDGLLLESDALLPSVASIVAGEPMRGSWWSHPAGRAIFAVTSRLADRDDVLSVKLVSRKVTWVHRDLWPHLFAAAGAREAWQMRALPTAARALLARLDKAGLLAPEGIPAAARTAARQLEQRLLAHASQVHTDSGAHRMQLESWAHRAARAGMPDRPPAPADARRAFDAILIRLNETHHASATLPWG
jgi:hypothetical protein